MPRKPRVVRANCFHHIMFRGVNGENLFVDNRDRSKFCLLLQEACEKHSVEVHGFCFMSNHIHLLLKPNDDSLQSCIHTFAFRYAQFFNKRHDRCGYLFQGRFRSIIVEDNTYLRRLIRYIHLNPVDAKVVNRPEQYRWSSYRAYLEQERYVWLKTENVLSRFDDDKESAINKFIVFTHDKLESQIDLDIISKAFRKGALGEDEFVKNQLEIKFNKQIFEQESITLIDVMNQICNLFKVSLVDLTSSNKNQTIVAARSALALIVRRSQKWSIEELSRILNKNSGTISRLAINAEKKDDLVTMITSQFKFIS